MNTYAKLFSSIVHSTIWRESNHVRLVWITMLAISDRHGQVAASVPGLADVSRVSVEECKDAIERLSAPDPHSRSKEFEGRRIAEMDGGWLVLNYAKHRDTIDSEVAREQTRLRVRKLREARRAVTPAVTVTPDVTRNADVTLCNAIRSDQIISTQITPTETDNGNGLPVLPDGPVLTITPSKPRLTAHEKGARDLVRIWNALFSTRYRVDGATFDQLVADMVTRCNGGRARGATWAPCSVPDVLCCAFIGDATGREFWRTQAPGVLLRTGAHARTSGNGATTGGTDHVLSLLTKPQAGQVRLSASALQLATIEGLVGHLEARGVLVPCRSEGAA